MRASSASSSETESRSFVWAFPPAKLLSLLLGKLISELAACKDSGLGDQGGKLNLPLPAPTGKWEVWSLLWENPLTFVTSQAWVISSLVPAWKNQDWFEAWG